MNAETNWTPGPRQVRYRGDLDEYHTLAEGGATIGHFAERGDALLDAAAPDLLRACEEALDLLTADVRTIRAALAKARGES